MSQPGIRDLLRSVLVEKLLADGNDPKLTRVLADFANAEMPHLVRPQLLVPFGRTEVEGLLADDPARFERASEGWCLAPAFRAALQSGSAGLPEFSPILKGAHTKTLHEWQREALQRWRSSGRRGIVSAVTGAGKTLLGVAAIEEHLRVPSARAVVLVPTIELMHQWCAELRRAFFVTIGAAGDAAADRLSDHAIVVYVARTASESLAPEVTRLANSHAVLLVADECHRYGAQTYARSLAGPCSATLGLSATPERDHDSGMDRHVFPALGPIVFDYEHERAVSEGVVSDFHVLFVGVRFEQLEQARHEELSVQIARARAMLLTEHPYLQHAKPFTEAIKILAGRDEDEHALHWLASVAERRRLLCNARQRHAFVEWLAALPELRNTQMLVFHESIADCEILAQNLSKAGIASRAHHSGLDRFERAAVLGKFANGDVRAVVSPHTLDEGIDVPDAALAIIVAGSRVKRQSIQRIGRVLRRTADKNHARVIRVFVRGGGDDPTGPYPDSFSKKMIESGRGSVAQWPEDAPQIVGCIESQLGGVFKVEDCKIRVASS